MPKSFRILKGTISSVVFLLGLRIDSLGQTLKAGHIFQFLPKPKNTFELSLRVKTHLFFWPTVGLPCLEWKWSKPASWVTFLVENNMILRFCLFWKGFLCAHHAMGWPMIDQWVDSRLQLGPSVLCSPIWPLAGLPSFGRTSPQCAGQNEHDSFATDHETVCNMMCKFRSQTTLKSRSHSSVRRKAWVEYGHVSN